MKNIFIVLILIILGILGFTFVKSKEIKPITKVTQQNPQAESTDSKDSPQTEIIAQGLDTPWAIAFLPSGGMLVTERPGTVRLVGTDGKVEDVATITQSKEIGEGGLMGLALDPDFSKNNFVYLYYTYSSEGDNTLNRVVKMTYKDNKLEGEQTIVDNIPGASNHNGGRIRFGPDKALYITTGDAQNPSLSQDKNSYAGKILRVKDEKVEVYSLGHRNPQGIAWDKSGKLWSTEHGPSGGSLGIGNDEVNQIAMGKNYGWPTIQGDQAKEGMEKPFKHSGSSTWAPAGVAITGDKLYFGGLRGSALFSYDLNSKALTKHFDGQFGRIREVILGPDNMLYITTSNKDGRGIPKSGDDKVIKINPQKL